MRLIDANRLKTHSDIKNWDKPYGCSFSVIDEQPTVEAKPVVRGEWIYIPGLQPGWKCSECHSTYEMKHRSKFCPNCGCDMRGKNK